MSKDSIEMLEILGLFKVYIFSYIHQNYLLLAPVVLICYIFIGAKIE